MLTVSVTCAGFARGDDEIEYCRTRMGGSMRKNLANGRSISGYISSRSMQLSPLQEDLFFVFLA